MISLSGQMSLSPITLSFKTSGDRKKQRKRENGKSGGNILIEAEIARGELQLILNGENGGRVSRRSVSRSKLKGRKR